MYDYSLQKLKNNLSKILPKKNLYLLKNSQESLRRNFSLKKTLVFTISKVRSRKIFKKFSPKVQ